jgi:acyl-CoA synthetase (AMP-forming)/AMP-acid ligase II
MTCGFFKEDVGTGTVGRAQGSVKVTILNDKNQPVPIGKIGEVCIRGPNVTKGYINRPEANEEAFAGQPSPAPCTTRSLRM